jgi:stringent starvation protein B
VRVPNEYVKDGEIVLNISFDATSALKLGNEFIEFKGRFGGVARDILVPINRVLAIYARENGQGMAFPTSTSSSAEASLSQGDALPSNGAAAGPKPGDGPDGPRPTGGRPSLTRIK